ncbi:MAG: imidazole glycerol phosphate synthase subunit HisH [Alphaproteobacteria bacterium]|nr:imidazole glycerol phosphate synthase subunit HisH [Alphaproteobacteria bacterium]
MTTVTIIDYGMGNLDSLSRAIEQCGGAPLLTTDAATITTATKIILPGVGAFPKAMQNLRDLGLIDAIHEAAKTRPILGICLGMQLLADSSCEIEQTSGLGLIPGNIERLVPQQMERVPHVGWNEVVHDGHDALMSNIPSGVDFYFVHSYRFACANVADAVATTPYCGTTTCIVSRNNVRGVQFHPEKSLPWGFQLLRNFLAM